MHTTETTVAKDYYSYLIYYTVKDPHYITLWRTHSTVLIGYLPCGYCLNQYTLYRLLLTEISVFTVSGRGACSPACRTVVIKRASSQIQSLIKYSEFPSFENGGAS